MADIVLKNNFFVFYGKVKRQKSGTAISTKVRNYNLSFGSVILTIYFLYGFMEKLTQFLNELNNFHSNLKFTFETSSCTVNFLDLNVSLRNGVTHTDIYIKPTDSHQYLHYQSSHPLHIKTSIPYSQTLRVSRIWSSEKNFKTHVSHMKEWFLVRGYPEIVVSNQVDKLFLVETNLLRKMRKWYFSCYYLPPWMNEWI